MKDSRMKVKAGDVVRIENPIMCAVDKTVFEILGVPGDEGYDAQDWGWAEDGCTIKTEVGEFPGSVGEKGGFYWIDREMILEVINEELVKLVDRTPKKGDMVECAFGVREVIGVMGDAEYDSHNFIAPEKGVLLKCDNGYGWYWDLLDSVTIVD